MYSPHWIVEDCTMVDRSHEATISSFMIGVDFAETRAGDDNDIFFLSEKTKVN